MKCDFCGSEVAGVACLNEGNGTVHLCSGCYNRIQEKRNQPYSKVTSRIQHLLYGYNQAVKARRMQKILADMDEDFE